MFHKLTINLSDDVYDGLHRVVGRGKIGRFLEDLARPHVTRHKTITPAEGFGCTGYKGPAPTDAEIRAAVRQSVRRRWRKKLKRGV